MVSIRGRNRASSLASASCAQPALHRHRWTTTRTTMTKTVPDVSSSCPWWVPEFGSAFCALPWASYHWPRFRRHFRSRHVGPDYRRSDLSGGRVRSFERLAAVLCYCLLLLLWCWSWHSGVPVLHEGGCDRGSSDREILRTLCCSLNVPEIRMKIWDLFSVARDARDSVCMFWGFWTCGQSAR